MTHARFAEGLIRAFAAWLCAFLACLIVFWTVAEVARQPEIPAIDVAASEGLHALASPALDTLMRAITALGSTFVLIVATVIAAAALVSRGHRTLALLAVAALVSTLLCNEVLKLYFERPRPGFSWAQVRPEYGFPSGHAMNSSVIYGALALVSWGLWGPRVGAAVSMVALVLAVAVGTSRIYLGVHWLTDVVGGWLAGALLLLVLVAALRAASRLRGRRSRARDGPPSEPVDMDVR